MNQAPLEEIASSMVRMRSCLARVELAASRLARESLKPLTRELAEGVSESVREIDDEIDRSLRILRVGPVGADESTRCAEIVAQVEARMAPILGAHAIEWRGVAPEHTSCRLDPIVLEAAALALLGSGIALAGRGGRLTLALDVDPDRGRVGLRLEAKRSDPAPADLRPIAEVVSGLRAVTHRFGAGIGVESDAAGEREARVTLWLATDEVGS